MAFDSSSLGACARGLGRAGNTYVRRRPEDTVLHQVVGAHLETFLSEVRLRNGGDGLPRFVERELREYLTCGVMARGFARFRCGGCARELLVAFSCKGRGFCPSCCGRRMCALAAHLVDGVFEDLPVRQWVLTLPHRLRYALAYDHRLCRAVLAVFVRAVLGFERRRGRERGVRGRAGAVTAIQRCGSALNTNIHFHTLVAEGVFDEQPDGSLRFARAQRLPTDLEVGKLLTKVRRRIVSLVQRHGIDLTGEDDAGDPLLLDSPALAQIRGASVLGRVATGPRAGHRVLRLGADPNAAVVTSGGPRQAHSSGFDLHANVAVRAGERMRLEHLCRYILRPPLAQDALEWTPEGKLLLHLRRPWRDGTRAICFEPAELLERLAAMVPRPRTNLLIYHGAFAPRGCRRVAAALAAKSAERLQAKAAAGVTASGSSAVGGSGVLPSENVPHGADPSDQPRPPPEGGRYVRPQHFAWADLLRRTFEIDVLACPDCGGRLRLLATIEDPEVIAKILTHLELPVDAPEPTPARSMDWLPGFVSGAD